MVKCLAQEHNTMSLAQTQTAQSKEELTNHEATVPPYTVIFIGAWKFYNNGSLHIFVKLINLMF